MLADPATCSAVDIQDTVHSNYNIIPTTNDFFTLPHARSQTRFSSQLGRESRLASHMGGCRVLAEMATWPRIQFYYSYSIVDIENTPPDEQMRTSRLGGSKNLNIPNEQTRTSRLGDSENQNIQDEQMRTSRLGGSQNLNIPNEQMRTSRLGGSEKLNIWNEKMRTSRLGGSKKLNIPNEKMRTSRQWGSVNWKKMNSWHSDGFRDTHEGIVIWLLHI